MEKVTLWTGASGTGLWFDAGNWSSGLPGRHVVATFQLDGSGTTDVSLAANGHNPVAAAVRVDAGSLAFEPGRLAIDQGGLTVEDGASLTIAPGATVVAANTQGGSGVTVDEGTLTVNGVLHAADTMTVTAGEGASPTQVVVSGAAAHATVSGQLGIWGAEMDVQDGAHLAATTLLVTTQNGAYSILNLDGTGTLARTGALMVDTSGVAVTDGARLVAGGGSETGGQNQQALASPALISPALISPGGIYIAGTGSVLVLKGAFDQTSGMLNLMAGGALMLRAGATFDASGTVQLDGGSIGGRGAFVLAGGTLLGGRDTTAQTLDHAVHLSGSGTIETAAGSTLTLARALAGGTAALTIGNIGGAGTVALASTANRAGSVTIAGGTLEVDGLLKTGSLTIDDGAGLALGTGAVVVTGDATLAQGGTLTLQDGAALRATGTLELAGGTVGGAGSFVLAGGTLLADTTQTVGQDIRLPTGATIAAAGSETLTLAGSVIGNGTLAIGSSAEAGTVALTGTADDIAGVLVADGELQVQGVLNTDSLTVDATSAGNPTVVVEQGGQLQAASVVLEGNGAGVLGIDDTGTVARIGKLTVDTSQLFVNSGASLTLGGGSESFDPTAPFAQAVIDISGELVLTGAFAQQSGLLEIDQGGALVLQAGAALTASDTVALDGGAIAGPGGFTLAGGTLLDGDVTTPDTLAQAVALSGSGTIAAANGATLTLTGAVTGDAPLTIGSADDTGIVALAGNANNIASIVVAGGTLQVQDTLSTGSVTVDAGMPGNTDIVPDLQAPIGGLEVQDVLKTGSLTVDASAEPIRAVVEPGGQLQAASVVLEGGYGGRLSINGTGTGTAADIGSLTMDNAVVFVNSGASMTLGGGSESLDATAPIPSGQFDIASAVVLTGAFDQQSGVLEIDQGGTLTLQAGAALTASGTVALDGGAVTGAGGLTLAGGTLQAGVAQTLGQDVALSGSGTIEAAPDSTLTVSGAVTGDAPLTIGSVADGATGTVALTNAADSFASVQLAGGTLELAADDVTGSGTIGFLAVDAATLQLDAGVSVGNTLMDFGAGDTLDLRGIDYSAGPGLSLGSGPQGGATLTVTDGTHTEQLVLGTVGSAQGYTLSADGLGGTDVTYTPP